MGNIGGSFVCLVCRGSSTLALVTSGELSKVTVVVTLPVKFKNKRRMMSENVSVGQVHEALIENDRVENLTSCSRTPWIHQLGTWGSKTHQEP